MMLCEWSLDKDIKEALDQSEAARYKNNMVGEEQRIKENNEKLKGTWKDNRIREEFGFREGEGDCFVAHSSLPAMEFFEKLNVVSD